MFLFCSLVTFIWSCIGIFRAGVSLISHKHQTNTSIIKFFILHTFMTWEFLRPALILSRLLTYLNTSFKINQCLMLSYLFISRLLQCLCCPECCHPMLVKSISRASISGKTRWRLLLFLMVLNAASGWYWGQDLLLDLKSRTLQTSHALPSSFLI